LGAPGERAQEARTRQAREIELEIKVDPENLCHPAEEVFMAGAMQVWGHVVSSRPLEQHAKPLLP